MTMRDPISGTLPAAWCREIKRPDGKWAHVSEIPLEGIEDLWERIKESRYLQDHEFSWKWAGISEREWDDFRKKGDPTARSRAEKHGAGGVMKQSMRANVMQRMPRRSVVGAVIVPAALANHPLACIQPGLAPVKADRIWINMSTPASEDAESFWKRCTESLAKAVAASRTRPIEVVVYKAIKEGWGYELGPSGTQASVTYTRIPVNPYSWSRLGQMVHPTTLRVLYLGALACMSNTESAGNGGNSTYINGKDTGPDALRFCGVDPDTWFERGGLSRHA